MTTGLVGQHQLAPFASPQPGQPLDATVVLGNDNSTVNTYDAHDSDSTIHFQSSALADRPPASTLGQKWLTTDAGARYIYYDNGSAWVEVDYFRDTGGAIVGDVTVTGNVSISGTLGVTGVATFTAAPILSSLTASKPVFTNSSKGLVSTGTLGTDQGGTNLTTYTTGDILYASATNVLSKLAIGTTGQHLIVSGGVPAWSTDSALGTVTSVSFTGGLISVATATTTPALTVAGTSGGVVYFSSASTWASSAALTASAIVLGGGAGAAPATTTTGTGVVTALGVNVGTAGAFVVNGGALGTPSSGAVAASLITAGTFGAGSYTFPGALAITGAFTGATTGAFSGNITVGSTISLGAAGTASGLAYFLYQTDANSRSWCLRNDQTTYGDFEIQQATTRGGGTYAYALRFDASRNATFAGTLAVTGASTLTGNVGVGAAPLSAVSNFFKLNVGTNMSMFANNGVGSVGLLMQNANYDGTNYVRINTDLASRYYQALGVQTFSHAVTGTAGSTITWVDDFVIGATGAATFSSTVSHGSTISVGAATPSNSGAGVTFPATQSASSDVNTLDDYKEGTWTPVITAGTPGNLAVTYGSQLGTYTKIGRAVTVNFYVTTASFTYTTASGLIYVTGLPYTANGSSFYAMGFFQGYTSVTFPVLGIQLSSTSTVYFTKSASGQVPTNALITDFPTGGTVQLSGSFTYYV